MTCVNRRNAEAARGSRQYPETHGDPLVCRAVKLMHQCVILIATGLLIAEGIGAAPLPRPESYPATERFDGTPATPVLSDPFMRKYATRIREAAKQVPNFAGRYRIATWGLGTSTIAMVIIDEKTGTVYLAPFKFLEYDGSVLFADGSYSASLEFQPLAYRRDSRLLIVRGCQEKDVEFTGCALYFYEWTGSRCELIKRMPARQVPVRP